MAWRAEPATATSVQAAGFGAAGLWFVLASREQAGTARLPSLTGMFHAQMAAVMIWMLTALPGMSAATVPGPVVVISVVVAVGCAVAAIPWMVRSFGPGLRFSDPAAAGQAVMSAGMAAMLIVML
jgi:hypothetical protein